MTFLYRKKEITIICIIIVFSVIYFILVSNNTDNKKVTSNSFVNVKIEGEVKKEIILTIPKGYTYGYVINKAQIYFNEYSYYDCNLYDQIVQDTTITIMTTDANNNYNPESIKISINNGTFDELITIYGIGEKRANKIIEYRKTNKIETYNELQQLLGVSNEVMAKIKSQAVL